ncbi:DUF5685 family protein [Streptomyces sp. GSL17-111]|uniref:DUF5685 family protein n=1 Tax=Streptomyces sp. GSL17-111 TaxID=3121596 RepID=UPI0030F3EB37
MFGIIRPCRHRLGERLGVEWTAHLCGLCLALRAEHGQFARAATNYDGLVISVLTEAQAPRTSRARRTAGPCPLRGMRTAPVARGEGARLAAAASLLLASAKVRDHVADGDGVLARRPLVAAAAGRVAAGWERSGTRAGAAVGFDTGPLLDAVRRQGAVEAAAGPGTSVLAVTEPTETASAATCAHTAHLAGRPGNAAPLAEVGRSFGRLAHLLDAVEDQRSDDAVGAWNPLTATGTSRQEARRLCEDAVRGIRRALREVEFTDASLARALLEDEPERSVRRAFGGHGGHGRHGAGGSAPRTVRRPSPWITRTPVRPAPRHRGPLTGCAVWAGLCVSCQLCCREVYAAPWSGHKRAGWCRHDCCDGCDCCGSGGSGGSGGSDGGCGCGCDC